VDYVVFVTKIRLTLSAPTANARHVVNMTTVDITTLDSNAELTVVPKSSNGHAKTNIRNAEPVANAHMARTQPRNPNPSLSKVSDPKQLTTFLL
jgi:hypothetical protein